MSYGGFEYGGGSFGGDGNDGEMKCLADMIAHLLISVQGSI